ncbi:MAG: Glyoxalase family protein [uncultured Sphingomonadaceae bacterium]|uniref:Glyoxalase family protein n=1 Tax=uncultured Sphingomonadaceae bacterium TaxID=169976 RepID=A0A6J4RYU7_9SPHN|nr:MAG: Glyoxalase family protein [uncultured Sphingomonadaceae bacterium]
MARLNYLELPVGDLAGSSLFFEAAFGLKLQAYGPTYAATDGEHADLGLQADPAERTAAPLPVIEVDDVDAAARAVEAAGGAITRPVFAFPGGRRFHLREPSGNELACWERG